MDGRDKLTLRYDWLRDPWFVIIVLAALLFCYPVIANHFYYRDDWARAQLSTSSFTYLGRFFGDYAAHFLSGDYIFSWNIEKRIIPETAPLFQLFSLFLYAGAIYCSVKIRAIPLTAACFFAVVAFVFNPFFIGNLLYRYDSLPMTIACSSALLSWALWHKHKIGSFFLLLLCLGSYQTFFNLFIFLSLGEFCYRLLYRDTCKQDFKNLVWAALFCVVALLVYRFILVPVFVSNLQRSDLVGFNASDIEIMRKKISYSLKFLIGFLTPSAQIFVAILFVMASVEVFMVVHCQGGSLALRTLKIMAFFLALALVAFLPLTVFLLLRDGVVQTRMLFVQNLFYVAILFLAVKFCARWSSRGAFVVAGLYLICPLAFCYFVNNGLANQDTFEAEIVTQLDYDLNRLGVHNKNVVLRGRLPHAPLIEKTVPHSVVARDIIEATPYWMLRLRLFLSGQSATSTAWSDPVDVEATICNGDLMPRVQSRFYAIYDSGSYWLVWLGEGPVCQPKIRVAGK